MLRNRELLWFTIVFAVIAAVSAAACYAVYPAAGGLSLASSAAYGAAFFIFTGARYRSIARISEQIDVVLHNEDRIYMSEAREGELSVLQSEITKMTRRIREQNAALKREKEHLADSLADIAHQLRTPLTSVNIILSLLGKHTGEERGSLLCEAEELLMRMDRLLTALLNLSRLDAGMVVFKRERVDVNSLIKAAVRPFLIPMELHGISVRIDVPDDAELTGDFDWLTQAMQNIIKNCMESIKEEGNITIACEDTLLFTEITVHDSGKGFGKEELAHLFERFYRGKQSKTTGYGIGMALCRTIIAGQGGTITARNHPQGGALFFIRFPK